MAYNPVVAMVASSWESHKSIPGNASDFWEHHAGNAICFFRPLRNTYLCRYLTVHILLKVCIEYGCGVGHTAVQDILIHTTQQCIHVHLHAYSEKPTAQFNYYVI